MAITGATGYSNSQVYDDKVFDYVYHTIGEKEADKYKNAATNYYHVEPDSHFFGSVNQIIAFVGYMHINKKAKKDLLIALENTKKNGYELKLGLTKDTLNSYAEHNDLEIKKIVEFIKNNY